MNQLVTIKSGGKQVALNDESFGSALNKKFVPMGARKYVAAALGLSDEDIKHPKDADGKVIGLSMKEIIALVSKGKTEEETSAIKANVAALRKEYDAKLDLYATASNQGVALLVADAGMKKQLKPVLDKNGKFNGRYVARFIPIKANGSAKKIADLEATIARLQSVVAGLPAPAVA